MKLFNRKLSLKEKILLSVILGVDKNKNVPYGELSFPFAPEISLDNLVKWVFCERPVFYTTISRMTKDNFILVENGVVKLLDNGRNLLATNFPYIFSRNEKWNGFWNIILFNIKESERYKRDKLRNYLIKVKFAPLSDGVWVSAKKINIVEKDAIYIEGKLREKEIEKVLAYYKIDEIDGEYKRLCDAFKTARSLHGHDRIPFLRSQFLDVFALDPQIPLELLPKDWAGEKAKKLFTKIN